MIYVINFSSPAGKGPLLKFPTLPVLISHVSADFMADLKAKKGNVIKHFLSGVPKVFFPTEYITLGILKVSQIVPNM